MLFVVAVGARHAVPLQDLAFAATQENGQPCPPECVTDSMEIETYYPSPYGYYEELRGDKIIVGDSNNSHIDETHLPPSGTLTFEPKSYAQITTEGTLYEGTVYYDSFDHEFKYYDNNSSWQPLGGGGDYWKPSAANTDNIYYNTGNVGIGTDTPQATLDITGSLSAKANNDILTALHINPSFNNGSFSGVKNNSLVIEKGNLILLPTYSGNINFEDFEDSSYSPWTKGNTNTVWEPQFTTGYNGGLGLKLNGNCVASRTPYGEHQNIIYTYATSTTGKLSLWLKLAGSGCGSAANAVIYANSNTIKVWEGSLGGYTNWTYLTFTLTNATQILIQAVYGDLYIDDLLWTDESLNGKIGIGTSSPQASLDLASGSTTLADAWGTRSSLRFKENLYPIDNALAKLTSLQGVYFDYKDTSRHSLGLVAEDVGRIFPELVTYEPDGKNAIALDYDKLSAVTIEAIKEQQREIEKQGKENSELREEIQELKEALTKTNRNQQKEIDLLKAKEKH